MDQPSGVEGALSPLGAQPVMGELAQPVVDDGDELVERLVVALAPAADESTDLGSGGGHGSLGASECDREPVREGRPFLLYLPLPQLDRPANRGPRGGAGPAGHAGPPEPFRLPIPRF
jgi:hypothetical protein